MPVPTGTSSWCGSPPARIPNTNGRPGCRRHFRLLGGTTLYSYTSLGALTFYEGFYEVDLMNFYTAQLLRHSQNGPQALALGWHLWSLLRGAGYLLITFEVMSLALQHLLRMPLATRRRRQQRWAPGLGLILADGLAKAVLLEPVRASLLANLGSSPSLRLAFELDNKRHRVVVDKRRIPHKILENTSPSRRNPADGSLWYRSVARSASIPRHQSGHRPKAVGCAS